MPRRALPLLAVVVLFALPLLPEIVGTRRLVFRDAEVTHWPWRRVATAALDAGEVPFVNASASGGQPLLANPNAALLYPTFLLERIAPAAAAFNLHYLLHVLWAFFGAVVLARRLRLSEGAAFFAGVAFAFSGMMLSYAAAFMNSSAAAAWLPWCAAALVDVGRRVGRARVRAIATAGLALGLQPLAGEPAISLLTVVFGGALALSEAADASPRGRGIAPVAAAAIAAASAGVLALAFAAPLLLPLRAVFPLTYRGQHLYSEKAFGAAAFLPWRALEWVLPRFGGDPGVLGGGASWLYALSSQDLVYIWCVTLGVIPLVVLVLGALSRNFWCRRSRFLGISAAVSLLFAFGLALPFAPYRILFAFPFLRRLRYPIKFYLLTTLCAALLSGRAVDALARTRARGRHAAVLAASLVLFAVCWFAAATGGLLDREVGPAVRAHSPHPDAFLAAFRDEVRGDAVIGAVSVAAAATLLFGARLREPGHLLGLLALVFSLVWALPLFVSAPARELARPPTLARAIAPGRAAGRAGTADAPGRAAGPAETAEGRIAVSPTLPRFDSSALLDDIHGRGLPRSSRIARVLIEQLVPQTGAPFGARYILDPDPDGSYGYYNRLIEEAATASPPAERDRLLSLFGARWALAPEGEEHPLFIAGGGLLIAGRHLLLYENPRPAPELRWAGRAIRRRSLSGTIALLKSVDFDPRDVVLPGRTDDDGAPARSAARLLNASVRADRGAADVDAEGPGHVVFSRTFFPAWRARVDGAGVPAVVANGRDVAVPVPAGRHRVEIAYDRAPFRAGVAIQAAALLLAAGALAAVGRR